MSRFDAEFGKTVLVAMDLTDVTTATNGDTIDMKGRRGALFAFNAHGLNSGTFTFKLQDSDDDSTWTDVVAGYVSASANSVAFADTADNTVGQLGYHGFERYVRCVCTPTSPVGTNNLSAMVIVDENYED